MSEGIFTSLNEYIHGMDVKQEALSQYLDKQNPQPEAYNNLLHAIKKQGRSELTNQSPLFVEDGANGLIITLNID